MTPSRRGQRSVVIVAPHFPPSNLTTGHRTRLFALHLHKFGWRASVLSVDPRFYEEPLDPELEKLVPTHVDVIRTRALPTRPFRVVGDLGIRSLWWHYRALCRLITKTKVDLVYIPIPPNFSSLLGPLVQVRHGVPFAVDYIDPWVHSWPGSEIRLSRAWWTLRLGKVLEPIVLRRVSLVTGVAPGYYEGALNRSPWLNRARCVAMPYGAEHSDYEYLVRHPRPPSVFDSRDGHRHVVYAGALLPRAHSTLDALFMAIRQLLDCGHEDVSRFRFHFIGTGSALSDPTSYMVMPSAERFGVSHLVKEHPARMPYLDVLNHLTHSHAVLILGSSEPHYTASKVFQAVLARRPVIGLLHANSSAVEILRRANAGLVVTFDDTRPAISHVDDIVHILLQVLQRDRYSPEQVDWDSFRHYSAEAMTGRLAEAFDETLDQRR